MSGACWWKRLGAVAGVLVVVAAMGCGGGNEEPVATEPVVLEDEELGIAVVVPPGSPFEPVESEAGEIRLRFPETREFSEGTVVYRAEPPQEAGVNLVDAVNDRKAEIEERPQGDFQGQLELAHEILGTAYSTRGRFVEDGSEIEEVRVFAVHPSSDRLLHMTYRYEPSPGQTEARVQDQAFEAFGYIEPLDSPTPDEPAP